MASRRCLPDEFADLVNRVRAVAAAVGPDV